jgi:hypothetical protein
MKGAAGIPANGPARVSAAVVDLADARGGRRLRALEEKLGASVDRNRRVLSRLFQSGLVYTRAGARLGRELLLARQHLLKVGDLLGRAGELDAGRDAEVDALARTIEAVLERTRELSDRGDGLLARDP